MPQLLLSISTFLEDTTNDDITSYKISNWESKGQKHQPPTKSVVWLQGDNQFAMNQQEMLRDQLQLYNCLICHAKAHKPILTRCGHLFCWQCFYKQGDTSEVACAVCGSLNDKNDTYPLFIEQDLDKDEDASVPERPLPVNRPKIPNADIIGARNNQYRNNVVMGRAMAGFVYLAPLGIAAYNQIEEPDEAQAEKTQSVRMKYVLILVATILVVLLGVDLLI